MIPRLVEQSEFQDADVGLGVRCSDTGFEDRKWVQNFGDKYRVIQAKTNLTMLRGGKEKEKSKHERELDYEPIREGWKQKMNRSLLHALVVRHSVLVNLLNERQHTLDRADKLCLLNLPGCEF